MYIKKHIICVLRTLQMQKKGMGLLFYIPLLFNWMLIPALAYFIYGRWGDEGMTYTEVLKYLQYFVPFLSAWWILFSFAEYVEDNGNELYFIQGRMRVYNTLAWLGVYLIVMAIPFLFYAEMISEFQIEYLRMAIECILFSCVTYMLLFLLASVPMTLVILLVYSIFSSLGALNTETVLIYYDIRVWSGELFAEKYLYLLLLSILALIIGAITNYRFRKYL